MSKIIKCKIIVVCFLLLSTLSTTGQQNAISIQGTVKDSSNQPVPFASVTLKNTLNRAAADENGRFRIDNIKSGNYILTARSLGYKDAELPIGADYNQEYLTIVLTESSLDIREVQVSGKSKATQVRETPYAVTSVDVDELR